MNKEIKLNFILESSMVHTEATNSNIATIYRETILKNDKILEVPALHGNSLRGLLRNLGVTHLFESIGVELGTIPQDIFHIFFSGGALTDSVTGVDIVARRNIRQLVPILSVLGSAMGDDMMSGKLKVSSLLPKCKELENGNLSYNDMTKIITYTRVDDSKLIAGDEFIKAGEKPKNPTQMLYDIETIIAGVELEGVISMIDFSELEESCVYTILEQFNKLPYIGGYSRAGHGRCKALEIEGLEEKTKLYKEFLEENKEQILEFLNIGL